jgi:polysaccharide export outer membrane protein
MTSNADDWRSAPCQTNLARARSGQLAIYGGSMLQRRQDIFCVDRVTAVLFVLFWLPFLVGCSGAPRQPREISDGVAESATEYVIGPGDVLRIFVWQNPDLTVTVPVRPDGRISVPLLQDVEAAQKTPPQLAQDIKKGLSQFIKEPEVTVIVTEFVGPYSEQVRVVGEAVKPQAIPYRTRMSVLDVMIAAGGLTPFAAGNRAVIVRRVGSHTEEVPVNLNSLLKDGDISANVQMRPGDILVIPQSWF